MHNQERSESAPVVNPVGAFEILSHPERVEVLCAVRQHGAPMSLQAVGDHVDYHDWDDSLGNDEISSDMLKEMRLHHVHLAALETAGILQYDRDELMITEFDEERLDRLLEAGKRILSSLHAGQTQLLRGSHTGNAGRVRLESLLETGQRVLTSLEIE